MKPWWTMGVRDSGRGVRGVSSGCMCSSSYVLPDAAQSSNDTQRCRGSCSDSHSDLPPEQLVVVSARESTPRALAIRRCLCVPCRPSYQNAGEIPRALISVGRHLSYAAGGAGCESLIPCLYSLLQRIRKLVVGRRSCCGGCRTDRGGSCYLLFTLGARHGGGVLRQVVAAAQTRSTARAVATAANAGLASGPR